MNRTCYHSVEIYYHTFWQKFCDNCSESKFLVFPHCAHWKFTWNHVKQIMTDLQFQSLWMASFAVINVLILISRKTWVAEKFTIFHTVSKITYSMFFGQNFAFGFLFFPYTFDFGRSPFLSNSTDLIGLIFVMETIFMASSPFPTELFLQSVDFFLMLYV